MVIMKSYGVITKSYGVITKSYKRERESWNNRFRLIIRSVINRMKRIRKNTSKSSFFSMTISTLISTSISITIILISTFNLNLTLFEPHPSPPSHSPRTLQCPLSSPHPLSPHSIPLVTSNFTSITFCHQSKSPWRISVQQNVIRVNLHEQDQYQHHSH